MIVGTKWSFHSKDEATRASKNPAVTVDSWSKNIRTALRSSLKKKIPVSNYEKFAFCKKFLNLAHEKLASENLFMVS